MALDGLKVGASLKKKMVSLVIQSRILLDSLDSINQQFEFEFEIFDLSKIEINIFTNYGNNEQSESYNFKRKKKRKKLHNINR